MNKIMSLIFIGLITLASFGIIVSADNSKSLDKGAGKITGEPYQIKDYDSCLNSRNHVIQETSPPRCIVNGFVFLQGQDGYIYSNYAIGDVLDFDSCIAAGNPVMESFPLRCMHEGVVYVDGVKQELNNKVVYGPKDSSKNSLDKYKDHCNSLQGEFNECGNYCYEGEVCTAMCLYVCENVASLNDKDTKYKIKDTKGGIAIKYENGFYPGEEYVVSVEDGYDFKTDLKIKGMINDRLKVDSESGQTISTILPQDVLGSVFSQDYLNKQSDVKIQLQEKYYGDISKIIYKVESDSYGKFLGIIKIKAKYLAEVDANSGEVLDWKGPWWAFLDFGTPSKPQVSDFVSKDASFDKASKQIEEAKIKFELALISISNLKDNGVNVNSYEKTLLVLKSFLDKSKESLESKDYISAWRFAKEVYDKSESILEDLKLDKFLKVSDFKSCVDAGYPVMESVPLQCNYNGIIFIEKD